MNLGHFAFFFTLALLSIVKVTLMSRWRLLLHFSSHTISDVIEGEATSQALTFLTIILVIRRDPLSSFDSPIAVWSAPRKCLWWFTWTITIVCSIHALEILLQTRAWFARILGLTICDEVIDNCGAYLRALLNESLLHEDIASPLEFDRAMLLVYLAK